MSLKDIDFLEQKGRDNSDKNKHGFPNVLIFLNNLF